MDHDAIRPILPEEAAQAEMARYRRPVGLDLFAGCGGMSLGFIQAGYEVIGAVEMDVYAVITYTTNLCRYGQCRVHFVTDKDETRMERALRKADQDCGLDVDDKRIVTGGSRSIKALPVAGRAGYPKNHPEHPACHTSSSAMFATWRENDCYRCWIVDEGKSMSYSVDRPAKDSAEVGSAILWTQETLWSSNSCAWFWMFARKLWPWRTFLELWT
jgi:hypothetical protein